MCIGGMKMKKKMMMLMATTMSVAALAGCGNAGANPQANSAETGENGLIPITFVR